MNKQSRFASLVWPMTLLFAGYGASVHAQTCRLNIEANDMMQYNARALRVGPECTEVELTFRHVGKEDAHVLGHDWVLARSSDVNALANAGISAGFDHGYVPPDDPRVIAATKVIGGGEETMITFSTAKLDPSVDYSFFCSYPGHTPTMRGRLQLDKPGGAAPRQMSGLP
jgi:azurin